MKFIGVLLDQHLTRKEHIKLTENKIPKNIGIFQDLIQIKKLAMAILLIDSLLPKL